MGTFRDWLTTDETELHPSIVENLLELHRKWCELMTEAPILLNKGDRDFKLQFPGRHVDAALPRSGSGPRVIQGPDDNYLIPVGSLQSVLGKEAGMVGSKDSPIGNSAFLRDQPYIGAYSQASPENLASTIIFVLMTIRADFMAVMQDFPVLMMMLMGKYQDQAVNGKGLAQAIRELEGNLLSKSNSATASSSTTDDTKKFRTGYSLGTTFFGTKYNAVASVWNDRQKLYGDIMNLVHAKNTVAVFEYLLQNVSGLAQAKAGFVVQLVFGELGCIDMHNVNLYSQFYLDREGQTRGPGSFRPDHMARQGGMTMRNPVKRDKQMYADLDPNYFSKKPAPVPQIGADATSRQMNTMTNRSGKFKQSVKRYIDVLQGLEKDGFNTIKLWDIWVAYVSKTYVTSKGGSRYSRTGLMAGNPMDPANDPTDARIMGTHGPIPDRNAVVTGGNKVGFERDPSSGLWVPKKTTKDGFGKKLATYNVDGMDKEQSAGAASAAHGATWWWRTPEYWWDQINQARTGEEAKDGFRYSSQERSGPSTIISKPLAYIATDPQLMAQVFPDPAERRRFDSELKDTMSMWDFWRNAEPNSKKWKKR